MNESKVHKKYLEILRNMTLQQKINKIFELIKKSFFNLNILLSTPEDTIIEKLYWSELSGGSQKQFTDALRVFEIQYDILDMEYIDFWVEKLLLNEIFIKLKKEAENI